MYILNLALYKGFFKKRPHLSEGVLFSGKVAARNQQKMGIHWQCLITLRISSVEKLMSDGTRNLIRLLQGELIWEEQKKLKLLKKDLQDTCFSRFLSILHAVWIFCALDFVQCKHHWWICRQVCYTFACRRSSTEKFGNRVQSRYVKALFQWNNFLVDRYLKKDV